jgi:hypothetical protein
MSPSFGLSLVKSAKANVSCAHLALRPAARKSESRRLDWRAGAGRDMVCAGLSFSLGGASAS